MTRFAARQTVVYFEEPVSSSAGIQLQTSTCPRSGVIVATPALPDDLSPSDRTAALRGLVDELLASSSAKHPVLWFYTPMMFAFASHIERATVVYDCMDELSHFRFAPPELSALESELIGRADVMFTGGYSLFEAKKDRHPNIHAFPSSVETAHFAAARTMRDEPLDQASIPGPRLGFYGVIDERMDYDLIGRVAESRPDWHMVMIGPVVKVDPATLPRAANIHYLGPKSYDQLPAYLAGWDAALMPFAINDATRFISPTKTLEYLAGGRVVVSTPVRDVVRHYDTLSAVQIASTQEGFIEACEAALRIAKTPALWMDEVDELLGRVSWKATFDRMAALLDAAVARNKPRPVGPGLRGSKIAVPAKIGTSRKPAEILVVGAGFAGSVMAERLATRLGKRVLVVDRRPHIAGNAFDTQDAAGVLFHKYGPHIFHTNSEEIFSYLSGFTKWRAYEHRVLARAAGMHVPMPINRTTINMLYGLSLASDEEAAAFMASRAEPVAHIRTSEDVVVSKVGRDLYERFFRGYTRKQWGMDPSELDKSVAARVPARHNTDDRYFTDTFQFMPRDGYTRMFESMLDHPLIEVQVDTEYRDVIRENVFDHVVFTGPIDEYFDFRFGKLPYRSLQFRHVTLDQQQFQPVGTVNYPDEAVPYTRITEYKHLTGQSHPKTTLTYEYPAAEGDPYYPVPRPENQTLFKQYEALARAEADVTFVGRLATYRYYNMDQVVGQALAAFKTLSRKWALSARDTISEAALTPGE